MIPSSLATMGVDIGAPLYLYLNISTPCTYILYDFVHWSGTITSSCNRAFPLCKTSPYWQILQNLFICILVAHCYCDSVFETQRWAIFQQCLPQLPLLPSQTPTHTTRFTLHVVNMDNHAICPWLLEHEIASATPSTPHPPANTPFSHCLEKKKKKQPRTIPRTY